MQAKKNLTTTMALIGQGINGAMANPDIMNCLKAFGYTEEKMTEGKTLFELPIEISNQFIDDFKKIIEFGDVLIAKGVAVNKHNPLFHKLN